MRVATDMTQALALRKKKGAIGLVLRLDGVRHYVWLSLQSKEQVINSSIPRKESLHNELISKVAERQANTGYLGSIDIPARPTFTTHQAKHDNFQSIKKQAMNVVEAPGSGNDMSYSEGMHAEEMMIMEWQKAADDYRLFAGRAPQKAEVYLSHCPCIEQSRRHSPARVLDQMPYPATCHRKLIKFATSGDRAAMRWAIFYQEPFQSQDLNVVHANLTIEKRLQVP